MKTTCLNYRVAAFVMLLLPLAAYSQKTETNKWREDLALMAREMPATHRDLFHSMSRESFDAAVKRLDERIPTLRRNQIIVEMMKIVAMVGDGHSNIYPTRDAKIGFHSLPVKLYLFKDGMFVRAADKAHADLVGSRVVNIGSSTVDDAISRVTPLIGHDNEMGVRYFAPILLTMPEVLNAIELSDRDDEATFILEKNGRQKTVNLSAAGPVEMMPADTDLSWLNRDGWYDMRDNAKPALWLRDPKNLYWYELVPRTKAVYAQINQVQDRQDESLADFSHRLISFAEATGAERLVIDLRLNRGGNGDLLRPLEIALIKSKFDQPGRLFFLIGRSSWSAAQFLLNWTEKFTNVIFVGEPSGSKGNVYGDSRKITLPNSGITIRLSVYYWQDWSPWDTRIWTAPQITAELSSADYEAGRDPALEAAVAYKPRKPLADMLNQAFDKGGSDLVEKRFLEFKAEPENKYFETENALLAVGQRLLNEKKPADAVRLFLLDTKQNPMSFRGYYAIGIAFSEIGDKQAAIENLQRALKLDSKNYDVRQSLKELQQR
jgi:tetratricopeptide (TPR) repeat protein